MPSPNWIDGFESASLAVGDVRVVFYDGGSVAVFRPSEAELYAVSNQCPHEGYPLSKGYVRDCVVTCPWHNFKFDLKSGACVMGDEAVRTYPLQVKDGIVQIDVAPVPAAEERGRIFASLERAMLDRKLGQAARDVVRLLQIETPPSAIALAIARFDARHAEYGTTHALPVAVDALALAKARSGIEGALPLMQAVDLASESNTRRPVRAVPAPEDPCADPAEAGIALRARVETEDAAGAEALLYGALARGFGRAEIEPWFFRLCADHFLDSGHALIYTDKVFDLLEQTNFEGAKELLGAHLHGIVTGTREEVLPEWTWFRKHLEDLAPRFPTLLNGTDDKPLPTLVSALLDAQRDAMIAKVVGALEAGASLRAVVDAISLAAATRVLRFDVDIDANVEIQEGWLAVTHTLTFANALGAAIARFREPDVLRLVLYGAHFVHNARTLDLRPHKRVSPKPGAEPSLEAITKSIAQRLPQEAISSTAAYLAQGGDVSALRGALVQYALDDRYTRPIVVGHVIKTVVAAFEESRALANPAPILAIVRLAASPVRERPIGRLTHEAIRSVVHGKVPRTLT